MLALIRHPSRNQLAAAGLLSLGVGAVVAIGPYYDIERPILIVAMFAALWAPIAFRVAQGRFDPFEPIVFFALIWTLMFCIRPVAMLITGDTYLRGRYYVDGGMDLALALGLLAAVVFYAGYFLTLRRRPTDSGPGSDEVPRTPPKVFLSLLALASLYLIYSRFGRSLVDEATQAQSAYLYLAPLISIPTALLLVIAGRAGRRSLTVAGYVLAVLTTVNFYLVGQRVFVLMPISALLIVHYAARRRRPGIAAILVAGAVLFMSIVAVLEVSRERQTNLSPLAALQDPELRPAAAFERFATGDTTAMVAALALQVNTKGEYWSNQPGYLPWTIVTRWVPSEVWADKPLSSPELLYARYFPGLYSFNKAGTAFTVVGELYYDSGVIGITLGMLALGWACARLWGWYRENERDPWAQAIYAPTFAMATIVFRGDLALCVGIGAFIYLPLLGARMLARRAQKRSLLRSADGRSRRQGVEPPGRERSPEPVAGPSG